MGARVVHRYVVNEIEDADLEVYLVWLPILPADDRAQAEAAAEMEWDPRVRHFWIADPSIPELFQEPVGLAEEKAWNVYLLYDRDARWAERAPRPRSLMHQGRKLPADRQLDGRKLADEVRALLAPRAAAGDSPRRPGAEAGGSGH